jgi:hypothetical protein
MKRYVAVVNGRSWDDLDLAIDFAKKHAQQYGDCVYITEIVGAVHPGKPRWRPTERAKRIMWHGNNSDKLF